MKTLLIFTYFIYQINVALAQKIVQRIDSNEVFVFFEGPPGYKVAYSDQQLMYLLRIRIGNHSNAIIESRKFIFTLSENFDQTLTWVGREYFFYHGQFYNNKNEPSPESNCVGISEKSKTGLRLTTDLENSGTILKIFRVENNIIYDVPVQAMLASNRLNEEEDYSEISTFNISTYVGSSEELVLYPKVYSNHLYLYSYDVKETRIKEEFLTHPGGLKPNIAFAFGDVEHPYLFEDEDDIALNVESESNTHRMYCLRHKKSIEANKIVSYGGTVFVFDHGSLFAVKKDLKKPIALHVPEEVRRNAVYLDTLGTALVWESAYKQSVNKSLLENEEAEMIFGIDRLEEGMVPGKFKWIKLGMK